MLLVVLLILLVGTASAAVSVNATQAELRAAGRARVALQARYVSEAAMMTSISYIDLLFRSGDWQSTWAQWDVQAPPLMFPYGEPAIDPNLPHHASRMSHASQMITLGPTETPPLGNAQGAGPPGPGPFADLTGSLGPRTAYQVPLGEADGGYVVDMTDCFRAPSSMTPGETTSTVQFYCVMTARARLTLQGGSGVGARAWLMPDGATYNQDPFETRHESRATIVTPPVLLQ